MTSASKCQRCGSREMHAPEKGVERKKRRGMHLRVKRFTDIEPCEYSMSICEECARAIDKVINEVSDERD